MSDHLINGGTCDVADLAPGDRIRIAGRDGTFILTYRIKSFTNVIEWCPDGTLAIEVTLWPGKVTRRGFERDE